MTTSTFPQAATSSTNTPAAQLMNSTAQAMNSAEKSVKHVAEATADQVGQSLHALMHEVSPALSRMAEQVAHLSRQGMNAAQNGGHQISEKIHHASDATTGYIRKEPVKAVLMAAALGAALVAVLNLRSHSHGPH